MPAFYVLLASVLWGLIGPVSRFALNEGVTALELAFWRAFIAAALFLVQALLSPKARIARKDWLALLAFGVCGVSVLEGSNLLAVQHGGASLAALLLYSAPAWVAILSRVIFRETLNRRKILALALSLAGIAGVAYAGPSGAARFTPEAIFWGLCSGLSYALFYVFGKIYFARYPTPLVLAIVFPLGALGLFPFVEFHPKSAVAWQAVACLGFASTFLAYFFYSLGLKRMEPTRAAVIASFEPVVAAAGAWWLWSEQLAPWGYFWGVGVVLSVILMAVA